MTDPATAAATASAGLVVMLDAAGRTIAGLEARVDQLTTALVAERDARAELEAMLAAARQAAAHPDTPDVDPPGPDPTDTRPHETPATPRPGA